MVSNHQSTFLRTRRSPICKQELGPHTAHPDTRTRPSGSLRRHYPAASQLPAEIVAGDHDRVVRRRRLVRLLLLRLEPSLDIIPSWAEPAREETFLHRPDAIATAHGSATHTPPLEQIPYSSCEYCFVGGMMMKKHCNWRLVSSVDRRLYRRLNRRLVQ